MSAIKTKGKVIAYTALHYGVEYLGYAMHSAIHAVDEWHIIYASEGSHGTRSDLPCPDRRDHLYAIAKDFGGDKLRWHEGRWAHEGQQREAIHYFAPDADVILVVDYDEIWPDGMPEQAIRAARLGSQRSYRVPMVHFYRGFGTAITQDPAFPTRVIVPSRAGGEDTLKLRRPIAHMGYAIRPELMAHKLLIHGHIAEFRCNSETYLREFYLDTSRRHDLHPVGSQYWHIEDVEPEWYLPAFMQAHPYWGRRYVWDKETVRAE